MCLRHPTGASHRGHCAACLLEDALAQSAPPAWQSDGKLTIQLPLGHTVSSSVFLVKPSDPPFRLLRLKTWHTPAPGDFTTRFQFLQRQFSEWSDEAIAAPLAAWVDGSGRPFELSEFHQGIPIVERAKSGGFDSMDADVCLSRLRAILCSAHKAGLVHGSIVGGNFLVSARGDQPYLIDFGDAALVAPDGNRLPDASSDIAGLDRLMDTIRAVISARVRRTVTSHSLF